MNTPDPHIVDFLDPVEIQVADFGSFVAELKKVAASSSPADRNVLVDLSEFNAVPMSYVKVLAKVHLRFKEVGRRLLVRANRQLRRAIRNTTYGKMLSFEVGPQDSDAQLRSVEDHRSSTARIETRPTPEAGETGYQIDDNRLIVTDTEQPWFADQLLDLTMGLESRPGDPAILDLSKLEAVSDDELRRTAHAVLHAQLAGRRVRVHALETHAAIIEELGLDRLLDLKIIDMKDSSGLFPAEGGIRVDSTRMKQLLAERSELPDKVREKQYEELGSGTYMRLSTHAEQERNQKLLDEMATQVELRYAGPNRRKPSRFEIDDALVEVRKKSSEEGEPSELVDLSQKGSHLFSEQEMFAGETVRLTLNVPDFVGMLQVEGKVVWARPTADPERTGFDVGVQFTRVPSGTMIKLRRLEGRHAV